MPDIPNLEAVRNSARNPPLIPHNLKMKQGFSHIRADLKFQKVIDSLKPAPGKNAQQQSWHHSAWIDCNED